MKEPVANKFVVTLPAFFSMSYLKGLRDGRYITVQLRFCRELLPGFVQESMQHPHIIFIKLFLQMFRLSTRDVIIKKCRQCCNLNDSMFYFITFDLSVIVLDFPVHILISLSADVM